MTFKTTGLLDGLRQTIFAMAAPTTIVLCGGLVAPLHAHAVSTLTAADASVTTTPTLSNNNVAGADVSSSASRDVNAGYSTGVTGLFVTQRVTEVATSAASLARGELKTFASAAFGPKLPGSLGSVPLGRDQASASSRAILADGFTTTGAGGAPFLWSNGQQARFEFSITGSSTLTGGVGSAGTGNSFLRTSMVFTAYQPGSIDIYYRLTQTSLSFADYVALSNQLSSRTIAQKTFTFGDAFQSAATQAYYAGCGCYFPVQGGVATTVGLSFAPGGDFDWSVAIDSFAALDAAEDDASMVADFSHTVRASYIAPAGAVTVSASGLFPGTVSAVPEPATALLMLGGAACLAALARRCRGVA